MPLPTPGATLQTPESIRSGAFITKFGANVWKLTARPADSVGIWQRDEIAYDYGQISGNQTLNLDLILARNIKFELNGNATVLLQSTKFGEWNVRWKENGYTFAWNAAMQQWQTPPSAAADGSKAATFVRFSP